MNSVLKECVFGAEYFEISIGEGKSFVLFYANRAIFFRQHYVTTYYHRYFSSLVIILNSEILVNLLKKLSVNSNLELKSNHWFSNLYYDC